jgi:hypothetical protein
MLVRSTAGGTLLPRQIFLCALCLKPAVAPYYHIRRAVSDGVLLRKHPGGGSARGPRLHLAPCFALVLLLTVVELWKPFVVRAAPPGRPNAASCFAALSGLRVKRGFGRRSFGTAFA